MKTPKMSVEKENFRLKLAGVKFELSKEALACENANNKLRPQGLK